MFFRRLHSNYRHGSWPMFSGNYKVLKFSIQSYQKLTSVKKHLSQKTLIGPGKLPGPSRNGPLVVIAKRRQDLAIFQLLHTRLLDMRWLCIISYPTRARGIIVKYFKASGKEKKKTTRPWLCFYVGYFNRRFWKSLNGSHRFLYETWHDQARFHKFSYI